MMLRVQSFKYAHFASLSQSFKGNWKVFLHFPYMFTVKALFASQVG